MPCEPYIPQTLPARVGWVATRSTVLSIPNTTLTAVTWPTEVLDTHAFFTPGGSVFTVPAGKAGLYAVTATAVFATAALGTNLMRIVAGGVDYDFSGNLFGTVQSATIVVPLAVADTVAVSTYHANGGPVNITSGRVVGSLIGL